jgi:hypothetical protein
MAGEAQLDFGIDTTDPVALAAAFDKLEAGAPLGTQAASDDAASAEAKAQAEAEAAAKKAEEDAAAQAVAAEKAKQDAAGKTDDKPEPEPDGVATKDGKHVIPYSVLKSERDRAARAEQLAREAQERVTALEAQVKAAQNGTKTGDAPTKEQDPLTDLSEEDLADLKENFPTVYKGLMASMKAAQALESKLKPVEDSVRSVEEDRQRTAAEMVQDAIDSTPKLAHIAATDKDAYELAKEFDKTLRTSPRWAGKSLEERFAQVVKLVEAEIGEIKLPARNTPPAEKSAEQLKKEAQAAAAAAAKATKTDVPTSLSDFPVGEAPAKDEREAIENMTPLQLAAKLAEMSPEKLDAYFQNL